MSNPTPAPSPASVAAAREKRFGRCLMASHFCFAFAALCIRSATDGRDPWVNIPLAAVTLVLASVATLVIERMFREAALAATDAAGEGTR